MKAKINKALDLNKLFGEQANGKLLKKRLDFPMMASIKYDGNYVVVTVTAHKPIYTTSGGLTYTHTDGGGDVFTQLPNAVYLAERIWGEGKLGDRNRCNLKGPKAEQTSTDHTYKIFDMLTFEEYEGGFTDTFARRHKRLTRLLVALDTMEYLAKTKLVSSQAELDVELKHQVSKGYEGIMVCSPCWSWKDTKTRTTELVKYKGRLTADLLCVGVNSGEGKYTGLIGSLTLVDSLGRLVDVGSGLSDALRGEQHGHFIGQVIEVGYEQIVHTYIQPTFIRIRFDKNKGGID